MKKKFIILLLSVALIISGVYSFAFAHNMGVYSHAYLQTFRDPTRVNVNNGRISIAPSNSGGSTTFGYIATTSNTFTSVGFHYHRNFC